MCSQLCIFKTSVTPDHSLFRQADGRKVLRSSIREFLCSEAIFALGIPTTRAGTVVTSDSWVMRDVFYDGSPRKERCSVVLRIAPTFIRSVLSHDESFSTYTYIEIEYYFVLDGVRLMKGSLLSCCPHAGSDHLRFSNRRTSSQVGRVPAMDIMRYELRCWIMSLKRFTQRFNRATRTQWRGTLPSLGRYTLPNEHSSGWRNTKCITQLNKQVKAMSQLVPT